MRKSSLEIAKKSILDFLRTNQSGIFKFTELRETLKYKRKEWKLAKTVSVGKFIDFLVSELNIEYVEFDFPIRRETRYTFGKIDIYNIIQSLNPKGYFSHITASYLNKINWETQREIYFNEEQTNKLQNRNDLTQESINRAFQNKPRITSNYTKYLNFKILKLSGKYSNNLGVIEKNSIRFTDVERTLIDIVVRPQYGGGVNNVLQIYRNANGKISVKKVLTYLKKLDYIYPYHQAIGFYLERAGVKDESVGKIKKMRMEFDFYLTNQMNKPMYSKEWRVYYPKKLN